jgi:undecaprenyl-diphosphatase
MTDSPAFEVGVLGVVQGLTEFLPVSSSGHLALGQILFGIEGGGLALNVMLHGGTLFATMLVLRKVLYEAALEGARSIVSPRRFLTTPGGRDALVVILATLPTGLLGLVLRDAVERWTSSPLAVGIGFLVTTLALASTRWAPEGEKESPLWWMAVLIGIAQGLSVFPGISRSGATICIAMWLGVSRPRAFELSMLVSLPAVLGAVAVEVPEMAGAELGLDVGLVGAALAFGVGVVALYLLRGAVVRGHFPLFALWTLPLGIATLAMARAWPG